MFPNRQPRADFRADPDGDEMSFTWNFDDGTMSTERNPTHTFTKTGTFDVTLTVTDERGALSEQPKKERIEVKHRFGSSRS